jgi:hypothetical protein
MTWKGWKTHERKYTVRRGKIRGKGGKLFNFRRKLKNVEIYPEKQAKWGVFKKNKKGEKERGVEKVENRFSIFNKASFENG